MSDANLSFRAHFDGKVVVPDEPVDLPVNASLTVEVRPLLATAPADSATIARRLAALDRFRAGAVAGASIPDAALRRENM